VDAELLRDLYDIDGWSVDALFVEQVDGSLFSAARRRAVISKTSEPETSRSTEPAASRRRFIAPRNSCGVTCV
jgi:hypothetical protein